MNKKAEKKVYVNYLSEKWIKQCEKDGKEMWEEYLCCKEHIDNIGCDFCKKDTDINKMYIGYVHNKEDHEVKLFICKECINNVCEN